MTFMLYEQDQGQPADAINDTIGDGERVQNLKQSKTSNNKK